MKTGTVRGDCIACDALLHIKLRPHAGGIRACTSRGLNPLSMYCKYCNDGGNPKNLGHQNTYHNCPRNGNMLFFTVQ